MLEAYKNNLKTILESLAINLTGANGFVISFLNFKHIVMVDYNESESN